MKTASILALVLLATSSGAWATKAPTTCTNASGRVIKQLSDTCPGGYTAQVRSPTATTPATTANGAGPTKPTLKGTSTTTQK
jgi:hypothetical protein